MSETSRLLIFGLGKAAETRLQEIRNSELIMSRGWRAARWLKEHGITPQVEFTQQTVNELSESIEKTRQQMAKADSTVYVTSFAPLVMDQITGRLGSMVKDSMVEMVEGENLLGQLTVPFNNNLPLMILDGLILRGRHHPPFSRDHNILILEPGEISSLKDLLSRIYNEADPVYLYSDSAPQDPGWVRSDFSQLEKADERICALFIPAVSSDSSLESFEEIISHLRAPEDGCPWDKKQTHESLRTYLLEETYETLDALDRNDLEALKEELGDILLQILLHSEIAQEKNEFKMADVLQRINQKIVYRHPHVFKNWVVNGEKDVMQNWESLKVQEREKNGEEQLKGMLDGVPLSFPALAQAQAIQQRAARVGFDWPDIAPVLDKVVEELEEVKTAADETERAKELGDLLFAIVNVIRWYKVDAESALRQTNIKFRNRFKAIEEFARKNGKEMQTMTLDEMDAIWEQAKKDSP